MTEKIFVVVNTSGAYSDYREQVIGVSSTLIGTLEMAARFANESNERWHKEAAAGEWSYSDDDEIVIRIYALDEYDPQSSKAEQLCGGNSGNGVVVWKSERRVLSEEELKRNNGWPEDVPHFRRTNDEIK